MVFLCARLAILIQSSFQVPSAAFNFPLSLCFILTYAMTLILCSKDG